METNAWNKLRELFEQASALDGDARAAFLADVRATNATLCVELETLLAANQGMPGNAGDSVSPSPSDEAPPPGARLFELQSAGTAPPSRSSGPPAMFKPQWAGRYLLLRRLGRGGMAEVFLARAHGPGGFERLVAVKRFVADYFGEEELKKRFEREAKVSASLTHPNIVHTYDFEATQGTYLLAMEYVKGRDLATILESSDLRGLPAPAAIQIVIQVAEALDYAYTREVDGTGTAMEVVHRDLSPRNIMIAFDGSTKLVDFGIARARGRTALTEVGAIRGTLAYLAPEVAAGTVPNHQSDLFSLFVVLYEALTGAALFDATHFSTLLDQIATCTLPATKVPKMPVDDALKAILLKGLAKDPSQRYTTAAQVVDDLDGYLRSRTQEPPKQILLRALQDFFTEARRAEDAANAAAIEQAKEIAPVALTGNTPIVRSNSAEATMPRRLPPGFVKSEPPSPRQTGFRPSPDPLPPPTDLDWKTPSPPDRGLFSGRRVAPLVLAAALAGGAYYWKGAPKRQVAEVVATAPTAAPGSECLVSIETEPPGAKVALAGDKTSQAKTPTTITVPCGTPVDATLRLDGYETEAVSLTALNEFQVVRRRLKGMKPGQIEFTLSHDAKVLLEGQVLAEVGAGQAFEMKVDGGKPYVFRFVNERLGIDFVERIAVPPGARTRKSVALVPK